MLEMEPLAEASATDYLKRQLNNVQLYCNGLAEQQPYRTGNAVEATLVG